MCGICGINGNISNNGIMLQLLLVDNESRGRDATGYAYFHNKNDKFYVMKDGMKASEFVMKYLYNKYEVFKSNNILGHTRAGTGGMASDNKNNHPFTTDNLILAHNGILYNDTALTTQHKLIRTSITDTEVIPLMMEKLGMVKGLESIRGSYALTWIDKRIPESTFLARNDGAPLHIGFKGGSMLYSSAKQPLVDLKCSDIEEIPIGKIMEWTNGRVVNVTDFTPMSYLENIPHYYYDYCGNLHGGDAYTTYKSKTRYNWRTDVYDYDDEYGDTYGPPRQAAQLQLVKDNSIMLLGVKHVYDKSKFTYVSMNATLVEVMDSEAADYLEKLRKEEDDVERAIFREELEKAEDELGNNAEEPTDNSDWGGEERYDY